MLAAAIAAACALLAASCASTAAPAGSSAAIPTTTTTSGSDAMAPTSGVCAGDTVAATYQTAYDGAQPMCHGFAGDANHPGEGLAGADTSQPITTVVTWMLLHARAIYSFQPPDAWMAALPHPRNVNGYFHRQANPGPGDTKLRAYKDYVTPAPGQPRNEQDYAMVAVIVSPAGQAAAARNVTEGGVWLVGCLVFHSDGEYMEPCPTWVWSAPVALAIHKRL